MSSSVEIIIPNIWKNMFQTTNQQLVSWRISGLNQLLLWQNWFSSKWNYNSYN